MIEFFTGVWEFVTSGNVVSWIVTGFVVLASFLVIYFRKFFTYLVVFTLSITGAYWLITTFDFTWVGTTFEVAKHHIERVIEDGKKK